MEAEEVGTRVMRLDNKGLRIMPSKSTIEKRRKENSKKEKGKTKKDKGKKENRNKEKRKTKNDKLKIEKGIKKRIKRNQKKEYYNLIKRKEKNG